MNEVAWEIAHSVDAKASLAFSWNYMTNVSNWDDPPATFELEGPFTAGSSGTTRMPGQEPIRWHIRSVIPMKAYVLEMALDRAAVWVDWGFAALTNGSTRLTQHLVLKGENAAAYVAQVQSAFAPTLAPGMNKIAAAIGKAQAKASGAE